MYYIRWCAQYGFVNIKILPSLKLVVVNNQLVVYNHQHGSASVGISSRHPPAKVE